MLLQAVVPGVDEAIGSTYNINGHREKELAEKFFVGNPTIS